MIFITVVGAFFGRISGGHMGGSTIARAWRDAASFQVSLRVPGSRLHPGGEVRGETGHQGDTGGHKN